MKDIRKDFEQLKINYGLIQKNYLNRSETKDFAEMLKQNQPLPDGIKGNDFEGFYTEQECNLSHLEIQQYIELKKLACLSTIKNILIAFFIVIPIIFLLLGSAGFFAAR